MGELAKEMAELGNILIGRQDELIGSLRAICDKAHKKAGGGYWMIPNAEMQRAREILNAIEESGP